MASDEEDFVFFGTPIEREEDITSRKKKSIAEASGQLRTLAPWKQEVRDEEGRLRFHGAFSGGFSAGYYNTVGSKEGWTPQTFTSSRKNRAEYKQQDLSNFLDDDEKAELEGNSLGTSMQFDTFGFTAAEIARKQSEKEQNERPSVIPGPAPDELIVPATDPIGVRLMLKMGWRRGQSVKSSKNNSNYDARREARKAFLALSEDSMATVADTDVEDGMETAVVEHVDQLHKSTPVYVLNPKQDMHGLGYDPFKGAPEFRENKRSHLPWNKESGNKGLQSQKDGLFSFKSRNVAPGFGIGALEELDAEDEDVYASGYDLEAFVEEIEEPTRLTIEDKKKSNVKQNDILPGFKAATNSDYQLERFDPPIVPKDFVPHHKFPATLEVNREITETPPTDVPPPADNNLKVLIEGVATLVARCGTLFEELSREKNQSNPLFDFLNGGNGHDYYKRKLWEARQKHTDKIKPLMNVKVTSTAQKLTADNRGNILGEKPLERTAKDLKPDVGSAKEVVNLQFHLSDTFTEPASFVEPTEITKPFQHDPAKQERFEQYLKEKYHGGLRTKDAGGSSKMSEADRARERLEFEAAAEATKQGKWGKESQRSSQQTLAASVGRLQFTSGGLEIPGVNQAEEMIKKSMFPKREEFQWRPASILCKRFDLIDPYMGKPPPAPRSRSKLDSLIFMPDYVKAATHEEKTKSNNISSPTDEMNGTNTMDVDETVEAENVERPVDLYKAIFSDDSDDEEESSNINQQEDPTKKIEAANTTLSRLVAGDFLESLGKELGLEVPPDQPYPGTHAKPHPTQNSTIDQPPTVGQQSHTQKHDDVTKDIKESRRENDNAELNQGTAKKDKKANKRYESSSEDERSRKRSKRDAITSDSSDDRDRRNSRHKERKREHRKHSKHRKHRSHESSSRSRHSADKEYRDSKREKRKSRD
ncbi:G patch domain-containing protein TGH [Rutidosis leptorrhynchoides]|uniref:G patch domain-containing protein TGH n=1 Tax=Rutidosis leptorrhynchoides TaxID=125765 RepID=UPI003A99FF2C